MIDHEDSWMLAVPIVVLGYFLVTSYIDNYADLKNIYLREAYSRVDENKNKVLEQDELHKLGLELKVMDSNEVFIDYDSMKKRIEDVNLYTLKSYIKK